jgi:hypothetical protein
MPPSSDTERWPIQSQTAGSGLYVNPQGAKPVVTVHRLLAVAICLPSSVLCLLCLLLTVPAFAVDTLTVEPQPKQLSEAWRWTEFNLPGPVRDIFEDREGNVWFATDVGAVRY